MADNKNAHAGHREKRRENFLRGKSFEYWQPHEVLEYLLFYALPRVDTNVIAHRLIEVCGGFEQVFTSPRGLLKSVEGVGDKACDYIYMLGGFMKYFNEYQIREKEKIAPGTSLDVFRSLFHGATREKLYLISVNSKGEIISKRLMSEGNVEATDVNIANIVKAAAASDAVTVVLAHNHPNGSLEPSVPDVTITEVVEKSLAAAGIGLRDHIIVTDKGCVSIKDFIKNGDKRKIHKFELRDE